jgi:hypothetical protein
LVKTSADWLDPTRASGLAAYGTAVTCCAIAWIRTRARGTDPLLAKVLILIESGLFLDVAFNLRWMLHQLLMDLARRAHEYDVRRLPQLIVMVCLVGLLISGFVAVWRLFRGRPGARLAVTGVLLSLVLWCTEVVSLHAVDHVLYHLLGNVMLVSFLWVSASLVTSIGVLVDSRQMRAGAMHRT